MAIRQLLFVMVWSPSVGDTEAEFHPYLRRNGREVMCFIESVGDTMFQIPDRKLLRNRTRLILLNIFSWKKKKIWKRTFPLLFPKFFTPPSCPQKCCLRLYKCFTNSRRQYGRWKPRLIGDRLNLNSGSIPTNFVTLTIS